MRPGTRVRAIGSPSRRSGVVTRIINGHVVTVRWGVDDLPRRMRFARAAQGCCASFDYFITELEAL